jgi:transcriptional regulator with XRE-family HTH domain
MQGWQLQEIIAENIKRVRKEMGLTQAELAESAGISSGYMCDIERSRRWPSAQIISRLAEVLKLDPFQLLLPTDDSPYFDRHRTLTSFSRQVKEAFEEKMSEVFDNMMQPYGPLRKEEKDGNDAGESP